ncbi:MAG: helix-turn-helix domain-containing protein [Chitinophagales bacterium]
MAHFIEEDKEILKKLGARIRRLRKEKGFSSHETFAYQHEISRGLYGKYERGENDLRFLSLLKILNALDISLKDFFQKDLILTK